MTLSLFTALASVTAAAGRYNECLSILDDARSVSEFSNIIG
jgi:hypothetical protein